LVEGGGRPQWTNKLQTEAVGDKEVGWGQTKTLLKGGRKKNKQGKLSIWGVGGK